MKFRSDIMGIKYDIYFDEPICIYDEMTRDELIENLLIKDEYIWELEDKIKDLEKQISDKINKDFKDNKKLVADIFNNLIKDKK